MQYANFLYQIQLTRFFPGTKSSLSNQGAGVLFLIVFIALDSKKNTALTPPRTARISGLKS